jgi:hypothetical protein
MPREGQGASVVGARDASERFVRVAFRSFAECTMRGNHSQFGGPVVVPFSLNLPRLHGEVDCLRACFAPELRRELI